MSFNFGKIDNALADIGVNGDDYTVPQLQQWLGNLGLAKSGNKATLILRLNSVAADKRGKCPEIAKPAGADNLRGNVEESDEESYEETSNVAIDEVLKDDNLEIELIKRERELLKRENELLKREMQLTKQTATPIVDLEEHQSAPISLIKELVPEFNENSNFQLWAKQIRSVTAIYQLNDNIMRAFIITKIKGKVLDWLHNNVDCASLDVNQLLSRIEEVFGSRESKLVLRQRFQNRKWSYDEAFADYFNEKTMLASTLKLDEEELIDHLIDGIPDQQMKVQALMQCFKSKEHLWQAFYKVRLNGNSTPKEAVRKQYEVNKQNTRCFNCNSVGHWKAECKKPKRQPGTCFGCGKADHLITQCPERKHTIGNLETNNYVSLVKFSFVIVRR